MYPILWQELLQDSLQIKSVLNPYQFSTCPVPPRGIEHTPDSSLKPAFRVESNAESDAATSEALADALLSLSLADRRALASWLASTGTASAPASSLSAR